MLKKYIQELKAKQELVKAAQEKQQQAGRPVGKFQATLMAEEISDYRNQNNTRRGR